MLLNLLLNNEVIVKIIVLSEEEKLLKKIKFNCYLTRQTKLRQ